MSNELNLRVSPYSGETNGLKQNNQNPINTNSDENNIEVNANNNNNNTKKDQQIKVEFNYCGTPYFRFGNSLFFYYPNSLKDMGITNKYYSLTANLSEMPDPPFNLGPECKNFIFNLTYI